MKAWLHDRALWKVDSCSSGMGPTTSSISPFASCVASLFSCESRNSMGILLDGARRVPHVTKENVGATVSEAKETAPNAVKYSSPETLQAGSETPTPSFLQKSQKVIETLSRKQRVRETVPSKKCDIKRGYLELPNNNEDTFSCPQWLECQHPVIEDRQQPETASYAPLTVDMLKNHESNVKRSTGTPAFSGDKLAKSVIRRKSLWELAREEKQRSQHKLEEQYISQEGGKKHENGVTTATEQNPAYAEWMAGERQVALAAKWRLKKHEQMEQLRIEKLRLAELERQRKMRLVEQRGRVKSSPVEI